MNKSRSDLQTNSTYSTIAYTKPKCKRDSLHMDDSIEQIPVKKNNMKAIKLMKAFYRTIK